MTADHRDNGGWPIRVSYNTNITCDRSQRGAHLFGDRHQAQAFADRNLLREPMLEEFKFSPMHRRCVWQKL